MVSIKIRVAIFRVNLWRLIRTQKTRQPKRHVFFFLSKLKRYLSLGIKIINLEQYLYQVYIKFKFFKILIVTLFYIH
jgi:hypothetical protein